MPGDGALLSGLTAAGRHHELLRSLVLRNLKVKYQRSLLGFVWTLLNPLLTIAVLVGIFSYVVRLSVENYWAFLISGYFTWNYLQLSINSGAYTLVEHANLSRSVPFPSEVLILSTAISRLVEFIAELLLILLALFIFHHDGVPVSIVFLPLLIVLQLALAVAVQFPVATLSVFFNDVEHALPVALTTLFYLSPVFYPASMVPAAIRPFYYLNPLALLLTLYHEVLYEGRLPTVEILVAAVLLVLALSVIGYGIFSRYKRLFPEIV